MEMFSIILSYLIKYFKCFVNLQFIKYSEMILLFINYLYKNDSNFLIAVQQSEIIYRCQLKVKGNYDLQEIVVT